MGTKYVKFEGSLTDLLQGFVEDKDFYVKDAGHLYDINKDLSVKIINQIYTTKTIYHKVDITWKDVVDEGGKVLCRVRDPLGTPWDDSYMVVDSPLLEVIENSDVNYSVTPVTLEEIQEFIYK